MRAADGCSHTLAFLCLRCYIGQVSIVDGSGREWNDSCCHRWHRGSAPARGPRCHPKVLFVASYCCGTCTVSMHMRTPACMCAHACTYAHTSMHALVHACLSAQRNARMHAGARTHMQAWRHASMQACMHVGTHTCRHAGMQAYRRTLMRACMYVGMHTCRYARKLQVLRGRHHCADGDG